MAQATAPILDSTRADLPTDVFEVRLRGRSGHSARVSFGLLMTQLGHSALQRHSAKIELLRGLR